MLLVCGNCGAQETQRKNKNRFMKRHPDLCKKKAEEKLKTEDLTKQLAAGTRSVDSDEGEFVDGLPTVEG